MQHYLVYNINNEQNCTTDRPTVYLKEGRRPVQHIERNIDWQSGSYSRRHPSNHTSQSKLLQQAGNGSKCVLTSPEFSQIHQLYLKTKQLHSSEIFFSTKTVSQTYTWKLLSTKIEAEKCEIFSTGKAYCQIFWYVLDRVQKE